MIAAPPRVFALISASLLCVCVACDDGGNAPSEGDDSRQNGDSDSWGDGHQQGDTLTGDAREIVDGEDCLHPIVLSWNGQTITRNDDSRDYRDDFLFGSCTQGQSWHYANPDIVYRLDFPAGEYQAHVTPELDYTYLSIIDVRPESCAAFESGCAALADSQLGPTEPNHLFTIEEGEQVYLVVDSYGNPYECEPGMCSGPFQLTVEAFSGGALGDSCETSEDCEYSCFQPDSETAGYCTFLCSEGDCAGADPAMSCAGIGPVSFDEHATACVKDSDIGLTSDGGTCEYHYACAGGYCVVSAWQASWDEGTCRTRCTDSCEAAGTSCQDVTYDLTQISASTSVKICVADGELDTKARGEACTFSFECQGDDICTYSGSCATGEPCGECTAP